MIKVSASNLAECVACYAVMLDADDAGYLGLQESTYLSQAKMRFEMLSKTVVLQIMKKYADPSTAKSFLDAIIDKTAPEYFVAGHEENNAIFLSSFRGALHEVIDREASKTPLRRNLTRLDLNVPKIVLAVMIAFCAFFLLEDWLTK